MSAAHDTNADAIPVIDMSRLATGVAADEAAVAAEMRAAALATGFFYISGHGIPQAQIDGIFALARRFFADDRRNSVTVNAWHRGLVVPGEAKMHGASRPDLKESFVWGLDTVDATPDAFGTPPNRWPDFLPELRPALTAYFDAMHIVGWRLMRAFALSLGLPADSFIRAISHPTSRASIIHYPPQPPDLDGDQFGVAPHTDWGCLTLLYQDSTGGLEVQGRDGWVPATPIPGTYVVNVGDLLARWTNDRFRSTPHRVVNRSGRERLSCAVFIDPDRDTLITPFPGPGETPLYEPVTCGAYVQSRFDTAFAYRQKPA